MVSLDNETDDELLLYKSIAIEENFTVIDII